jgi:O-acetylhomoserine (thiol)-lyase
MAEESDDAKRRFDTASVHVGQDEPDPATGARAPPIYRTTSSVFEERMASLDLATFVLAGAGDNVVTASSLYGGTYTYFTHTAPRRGIETRFVDNTFATAALCRPSDTRRRGVELDDEWLHGHGTTIGGVLIDGGSFPALAPDGFERFTPARPSPRRRPQGPPQ